jgi:hypothetical protein
MFAQEETVARFRERLSPRAAFLPAGQGFQQKFTIYSVLIL